MENIPKIKELTDKLSDDIEQLDDVMKPFLDEREMEDKFTAPEDRAKYYTCLAYSLTSILFAYLKSVGKDTNNHEIMKELDRVKSYMAKVKETVDGREKPRVQVDKDVANRFIKNALAGNDDKSYLSKMAQNTDNPKKRTSDDSDIEEISKPAPKKKAKKKKSKK